MPVYASTNIKNPLVGFTSSGGGFQVASGIIVLDLSDFQSSGSPNDWLKDDIFWEIDVNTTKWKKPVIASLIAFPLSFDASAAVGSNQLGWGIDSCGLDPNFPVGRTDVVGVTAKLVVKTKASEVLRVGYQLTLSTSDGA